MLVKKEWSLWSLLFLYRHQFYQSRVPLLWPHFTLIASIKALSTVDPKNDRPVEKGSWLPTGLKFINRTYQPLLNRSLSCKPGFREKPELNCPLPAMNWLYCVPAVWASPYKGVSWIVFQPIGLRLSLSNQSCTAISLLASSLNNQTGSIPTDQYDAFWTNQTVSILESLFAWGQTNQGPGQGVFAI